MKIIKEIKQKYGIFIPLALLSLVFVFSVSFALALTVCTTFATNISPNNITNHSNNLSKIGGGFEGSSDSANGDYLLIISDVRINGEKAPLLFPTMHQGDKLKVEVELTGPYPGWRHLNFYLIKFGQTIWHDTVLTNLFTGKASVTIDSKKLKLTPDEYSLEVLWSDTSNAVLFYVLPSNTNTNNSGGDEFNHTLDNYTIPAAAVNMPMQPTGTPVALAALGLLGIIVGALYGKIR